ncbi:MAG: hypothetical protein QHH13_04440 [Melioribacter sp.]|uniref:ImmA/IrrE family metallo-endopeptidase n=1 Tax=Rosettibacter primus TaxID=3111523 RepID=UPI00247EB944|nr:hypothetical protein [Melioribacter sp.]
MKNSKKIGNGIFTRIYNQFIHNCKKTGIISFFFLCLVFLFSNNVFSQYFFLKHYETKEALELDANKIIADFSQFVKNKGYSMPDIPKVKIQTEPFLIKLDKPNNVIIVPYWKDLTNEQKEIFKSWWGDNAEEQFTLMFNWFFIAHELGHYISPMIHDLNPYQCEKEANEVAVTFFRRNSANIEKLDYVEKSLKQVLEMLPKIDFGNLSEAEYFNANYKKIGNIPNLYGYFQIKFVLNALNNHEDFSIKHYFEEQTK